MVSKMMLHTIVRFLVFFAAVTGAEALGLSSSPLARSLQIERHFSAPEARDMPPTDNAAQRVVSPSPTPNNFPTNLPTFLPTDVQTFLFPTPEPSAAPVASATSVPTTAPTPDAIATTTTPPTAGPTPAADSSTLFTPTAAPEEFPGLEEEETPSGGVGSTQARGGFGPGAGTALGAGLLVLIGGVFVYRRKGKKGDPADATSAQPMDLEGGSSA